jgi:plasmid stabilization system protein ParE
VTFAAAAAAELVDAVRYYENQSPGLGAAFLSEVHGAVSRIQALPFGWRSISPNTRRCLLHRFPYGIIYQARQGRIRIIAIAHLHRKPGYWSGRS